MPSIAIITDTDSSLPGDVAARYGIRQVPIVVQFGDESFLSEVEISDAEVFERIDREGTLPTTSAPSPGQFVEAYEAAFDDGADAVICFCVSSEVSATYSAAVTARELMPERDITVVDTLSLSVEQGFMALVAAEAAQAGASKEEIVEKALAVRERTCLYASLSTLKYLAMSGRVGGLVAGMANLLNIKPILSIQDGKLDMLEKVRTRKKAWARVIDLTAQKIAGRPVERMAILNVAVPDDAQRFQAQVLKEIPFEGEILFCDLSAGLSVHAGSGVVGVVAVVAE